MCGMENIKLDYDFQNPGLLETAFTHPSHRHEKGGKVDNQRLEFLGDAVIGCIASEILYKTFPDADEGEISMKKSAIVSKGSLAGYAGKLSLSGGLLLGKGEEKEGRERESNLADVFEAVIGAVFLDGGYEAARRIVSDLILQSKDKWMLSTDYKSELQRVFHQKFSSLPVYKTEETGPEHQRYFFSEVGNGSEVFGRGQGRNKKEAEQRAAKEGLEALR